MQSSYPASFDREVGCTDAEWRMWLPAALGERAGSIAQGSARVDIDGGHLELTWEPMPPRVIALVRLPRLAVRFRFENVEDDRRNTFMRRFDLYMHRGGG